MVEISKKQVVIISVVAVVAIAAIGAFVFMNGHDVRIVVTNSMDGDVHPDGCYYCDSCKCEWLPNNLNTLKPDEHPSCPYCNSTNTRYVEHSYKIGKVAVNSLIVTEKLDSSSKQNLNVGDVISFNYNGRETIHRIIEIYTTSGDVTKIVTSGDNTTGTEITTDLSEVHGIVVKESSFLGGIVHAVQSSTILLILMVVIIIIIISVIRDMIKMSQRDKDRSE